MPSIFSVAKSKLLGRNKSRSKKSKAAVDSEPVNGAEEEKLASPQVSIASHVEIIEENPGLPTLTIPYLESGTQSDIVSSIPTDGFQTPIESGNNSTAIVHRHDPLAPEETKLVDATQATTLQPEQIETTSELPENDTNGTKLVQPMAAPPEDEVENNEANEGGVDDDGIVGSISPVTENSEVPEPGEDAADNDLASEETQILNGAATVTAPTLDPQSVVQNYEQELEAISGRLSSMETELQTALDAVVSQSADIECLLAEQTRMRKEIVTISREKEEALRSQEEEGRSMKEKLEWERESLRRATKEREDARAEIDRIRATAAVDKRTHEGRAKEHLQEKEQLAAEIESSQAEIAGLKLQIQGQTTKIEGLEARLKDGHEASQGLNYRYQDQEEKIQRLDAGLQAARKKAETRDTRIRDLERRNETLSTSLVEEQDKSRRLNDVLVDQLRQQSDMPRPPQGPSRGQAYADSVGADLGRFMSSSHTNSPTISRGIKRGAATAIRAANGTKTLENLNEEIDQVAATLTDKLEKVNKRFVNDGSLPSTSGGHPNGDARLDNMESLKSTLGLDLIQRLEAYATRPMDYLNYFYLQTALQGCLTACCMRIITSWYPDEWEYGQFLEGLYERIRGRNGLEIALVWRTSTQQNCFPSAPQEDSKLLDYLMNHLRSILRISGWSNDEKCDAIIESLRPKLLKIVAAAIRLNNVTAIGVPGELEPMIVKEGSKFDPKAMDDHYADETTRYSRSIPNVSCAVAIGLKWADNTDVNAPLMLVKPRVILTSALQSISDPEAPV